MKSSLGLDGTYAWSVIHWGQDRRQYNVFVAGGWTSKRERIGKAALVQGKWWSAGVSDRANLNVPWTRNQGGSVCKTNWPKKTPSAEVNPREEQCNHLCPIIRASKCLPTVRRLALCALRSTSLGMLVGVWLLQLAQNTDFQI